MCSRFSLFCKHFLITINNNIIIRTVYLSSLKLKAKLQMLFTDVIYNKKNLTLYHVHVHSIEQ